jgi:hypothetical protein
LFMSRWRCLCIWAILLEMQVRLKWPNWIKRVELLNRLFLNEQLKWRELRRKTLKGFLLGKKLERYPLLTWDWRGPRGGVVVRGLLPALLDVAEAGARAIQDRYGSQTTHKVCNPS